MLSLAASSLSFAQQCSNTCPTARNGVCEDGGDGSADLVRCRFGALPLFV